MHRKVLIWCFNEAGTSFFQSEEIGVKNNDFNFFCSLQLYLNCYIDPKLMGKKSK